MMIFIKPPSIALLLSLRSHDVVADEGTHVVDEDGRLDASSRDGVTVHVPLQNRMNKLMKYNAVEWQAFAHEQQGLTLQHVQQQQMF